MEGRDREEGEVFSDDEFQLFEIKSYNVHDNRSLSRNENLKTIQNEQQYINDKKTDDSLKNKQHTELTDTVTEKEYIDQQPVNIGEAPLESRNSEDMDISPVESIQANEDITPGCVMEVNSPLYSGSQTPYQVGNDYAKPVIDNVNKEELIFTTKDKSQIASTQKKKRKRFSKKFLEGIKSLLLDGLTDDLSSSSESEDFQLEDKIKELRFQLSFHYDELRNAVEKRNAITKELQKCDCVIAHHQETIAEIEKKIALQSNDLIKEYRSKGRKNKRKYDNVAQEFQSRVEDLITQLNGVEKPIETPKQFRSNDKENEQYSPDLQSTRTNDDTNSIPQIDSSNIMTSSVLSNENVGEKRRSLLSKEEELRQKLMNKKNFSVNSTPVVKKMKLKSSNDEFNTLTSFINTVAVVKNPFKQSEISKTDKMNSFLFEGPLTYVRSFILDPIFPIKESIEILRLRIDPNIPICYYEVFGYCCDTECKDQHIKEAFLSDQQLLEEVLSFIPGRKMFPESLNVQASNLLKNKSLEAIIFDLRREVQDFDFIQLAVQYC